MIYVLLFSFELQKVEKLNSKCTNKILKVFGEFVSGRIPNINFGTCYQGDFLFHSYKDVDKLIFAD